MQIRRFLGGVVVFIYFPFAYGSVSVSYTHLIEINGTECASSTIHGGQNFLTVKIQGYSDPFFILYRYLYFECQPDCASVCRIRKIAQSG